MGSDLDSLHRFLSDHLGGVVVALALVVLALTAIVWLWARRVSAMRSRLAAAEAAAGTAASAAAAALAMDSLLQPVPGEGADPPLEWDGTAEPEAVGALQPAAAAAGASADPGTARWAAEGATWLAPPRPEEAPPAGPEPVAAWMQAAEPPRPAPAPEPAEATEPAAPGSRLLLVEDDVNVAKLYRLLLESRGYAVRHAADGVEGLDAARRERPDLILLDVMMPRMNGITFLQALRDDPALGAVPAVVLSNFREPRLVERAMALGALEYMVKAQTRPEALIGAIPHWLRGERADGL